MSVRKQKWRDKHGRQHETWMTHICHTWPVGCKQTIRKVSPVQTKRGAEQLPEITLLEERKSDFDFLDFDEAEAFLAGVLEHRPRWYPYMLVAMRTGLRVGEMVALRRRDIDLDRGGLLAPAEISVWAPPARPGFRPAWGHATRGGETASEPGDLAGRQGHGRRTRV